MVVVPRKIHTSLYLASLGLQGKTEEQKYQQRFLGQVQRILQAGILEWAAIPFSRESS